MAARKLVGSISRPAKTIFLQRPQKSPIINPIRHFLLKSSPKPKRPNPHHVLGFRSPATKSHPFSTESEIEYHSHWLMECRRRLGMDDGDLVLLQHPFAFWRPPRDGEIKISFCGTFHPDHYDHDDDEEQRGYIRYEDETGAITAIARNSAGDVRGVTAGLKEFKHVTKVEMQLYALKASVNLAKELKITGMHDGPVVYESTSRALSWTFCESKEVIMRNMPRCEDLEEFGRSCPIFCGNEDKLTEIMPHYLHTIFGLVQIDKAYAGLA